jgi:hypothetical protein
LSSCAAFNGVAKIFIARFLQRDASKIFQTAPQQVCFCDYHNCGVFVLWGVRAGFVIPVIALGFSGAQNGN